MSDVGGQRSEGQEQETEIRRFRRLTQKEKEELATRLRSASYAWQADSHGRLSGGPARLA
jgi:hypothetical protein